MRARQSSFAIILCAGLWLALARPLLRGDYGSGIESGSIVDMPSIHVGQFDIGMGGTLAAVHDDNIFISSTNTLSDSITRIAPFIFLGSSDYKRKQESYVLGNYLADARFFSDNPDLNYINQDLSLGGQYRNGKSVFRLQQVVRLREDTSVEVGQFVKQRLYTTLFEIDRDHTEKTGVYMGFYQRIRDYDEFTDNTEWSGKLGVRYDYSPKTRFRLETILGYIKVDGENPDQHYASLSAGIDHALSPKWIWHLTLGREHREITDLGVDKSAVLGEFGISYLPDELTTVSLDVVRSIQPAISTSSADVTSSAAQLSIQKRFLDRITGRLTAEYRRSSYDYASSSSVQLNSREDDHFMFEGRLSYRLYSLWNLYTAYQYRTNESSLEDRTFKNTQVEVGVYSKL